MRKEYDFSKSAKNPYTAKLKKQITIRIDEDVIEYFKKLADASSMRYQNLMNSYLRKCKRENLTPTILWKQVGSIDKVES